MASGANFGFRRTIPHMMGVGLGFVFMILVLGMGLARTFAAYPTGHEVLKTVAVIYLLWLAWKIANAAPVDDAGAGRPLTFLQAAAFQWVNPKAWVMGSSALAAFTSLEANFLLQVIIVAGTFLIITIPSAGIWLIFGAGLQHVITNPNHLRIFNLSMAVLLVASILPVIRDFIA